MILYHATTPKKLARYKATGAILPPVRGWITLKCAQNWAKKKMRTVILEINPGTTYPLPDHQPRMCAYWSPCVVYNWKESEVTGEQADK